MAGTGQKAGSRSLGHRTWWRIFGCNRPWATDGMRVGAYMRDRASVGINGSVRGTASFSV
eukprot:4349539-Pleurochrysis_carterae.AAC.1